jgi:hypothetical protein
VFAARSSAEVDEEVSFNAAYMAYARSEWETVTREQSTHDRTITRRKKAPAARIQLNLRLDAKPEMAEGHGNPKLDRARSIL